MIRVGQDAHLGAVVALEVDELGVQVAGDPARLGEVES